jgi:hypothetical protein
LDRVSDRSIWIRHARKDVGFTAVFLLLAENSRAETLDLILGNLGNAAASGEFPGRASQSLPKRRAESARGFITNLVGDPVERLRATDQ